MPSMNFLGCFEEDGNHSGRYEVMKNEIFHWHKIFLMFSFILKAALFKLSIFWFAYEVYKNRGEWCYWVVLQNF